MPGGAFRAPALMLRSFCLGLDLYLLRDGCPKPGGAFRAPALMLRSFSLGLDLYLLHDGCPKEHPKGLCSLPEWLLLPVCQVTPKDQVLNPSFELGTGCFHPAVSSLTDNFARLSTLWDACELRVGGRVGQCVQASQVLES